MQLEHSSGQCTSFTDSSHVSLKAVLLHNGKEVPSTPLFRAAHLKVTYENLHVWLQEINYEERQLKICVDLNATAMQTVLLGGYTKLCCF